MPIPSTAVRFEETLDPSEELDFDLDVTQGPTVDDLLREGEGVASFTVALTAESQMAGLTIMEGDGRSPSLQGLELTVWLTVTPTEQSASIFNASGTELAFECTFKTDAVPSRTRQMTAAVRVVQK